MAVDQVVFHARYISTDFDAGAGPGQLFDPDPREGAFRAYRRLLRKIRSYSKSRESLNWRVAAPKLRPSLQRIARDYWRDYDVDTRIKSEQIKPEAKKLIASLRSTIRLMNELPPFARRGLNAKASLVLKQDTDCDHDVLTVALDSNRALLAACCAFVERDHRKGGSVVRFENAARDLCSVWEDIFGRRFPRNRKMVPASDQKIKAGLKRRFENPAANFVLDAILEIGNPLPNGRSWVKASQVEEALAAVFRGK